MNIFCLAYAFQQVSSAISVDPGTGVCDTLLASFTSDDISEYCK